VSVLVVGLSHKSAPVRVLERVTGKLLHAPTVRVKELAGSPGGEEYTAALRVLFDLDPRAVEAVSRAGNGQEGAR
jgi:glutamyl-tRNA reductase